MKFLQFLRLLEKTFGSDGEELGGIHGTILIQESIAVTANVTPELLVVFLQDAGPGDISRMVLNDRRTVTFGPGTVKLVRKFVKDNVMTIMNIGCTAIDVVP